MIRVPWSTLSGEAVEDFVSQILLLRHANKPGNRIRPSKGDKGMDVRIREAGGLAVYQVKRYATTLSSSQRSKIKSSFERFVNEVAAREAVVRWELVMPLDPTPENIEWFESLTDKHPFECRWTGLSELDSYAAENSVLVEYHFGDPEPMQRTITELLHAGSPVMPGLPPESRLDAISTKMATLAKSLDDLDPHYRYEVELHRKIVDQNPLEVAMHRASPGRVVTQILDVESHWLLVHTIARCSASTELRPIKGTLTMVAKEGSEQQKAIEDFITFGAPLVDMPATMDGAEGPPFSFEDGQGIVTFMPSQSEQLPPLSIVLENQAGRVVFSGALTDVRVASGTASEPGYWLSAKCADELVHLESTVSSGRPSQLRIRIVGASGIPVANGLSLADFLASHLESDNLGISIRGTNTKVSGPWKLSRTGAEAEQAQSIVRMVRALISMQAYTMTPILMPRTWSDSSLRRWEEIARMLNGEAIQRSWESIGVQLSQEEDYEQALSEERAILVRLPLEVEVDSTTYGLSCVVQYYCASARFTDVERAADGTALAARAVPVNRAPMDVRVIPSDSPAATAAELTSCLESGGS